MQRPVQKAYILVSNDPNEIQKRSAETARTLYTMISTCLGPRAMQKMVITKMNSIQLTNDGNTILRELDVSHPSARCLIELSATQDNICGDGTTSVVILASKLLSTVVEILDDHHAIHVCSALTKAKDICIKKIEGMGCSMSENIMKIVEASVSTKMCAYLNVPIAKLAYEAAEKVKTKNGDKESFTVDIKTDVRVEKILGMVEESHVLDGILMDKDIVHPQMRRKIENPRIVVLDCPLEYKKGESVTNMEFYDKTDFEKTLQIEEEQVRQMCAKILEVQPDVLVTEKGICDLALSILFQNNVTAVRRIKKTEAIRICKCTGASMVTKIEDLKEKHVGNAGLFEYIKINESNYCKISGCKDSKAVTVVLRGPSQDILAELERNLMDALRTCKNILADPMAVPGGGATEMNCALTLEMEDGSVVEKQTFAVCAEALKTIPSILIGNSGAKNPLEVLNSLSNKLKTNAYCGISISGEIKDMREIVMEPIIVKLQCIKSAFDAVSQLLRVDGIIEAKTKLN